MKPGLGARPTVVSHGQISKLSIQQTDSLDSHHMFAAHAKKSFPRDCCRKHNTFL